MFLSCFMCPKKFNDVKKLIDHLKLHHYLRDNTCTLNCMVNYKDYKCGKAFHTFNKLQKHLKECLQSREVNEVDIQFFESKEKQTYIFIPINLGVCRKCRRRCIHCYK